MTYGIEVLLGNKTTQLLSETYDSFSLACEAANKLIDENGWVAMVKKIEQPAPAPAMKNIRVHCKNPADVESALRQKFHTRKWNASCRLCQDGSIAIACKDDTALCQVETFLDMIITDEYQIADE